MCPSVYGEVQWSTSDWSLQGDVIFVVLFLGDCFSFGVLNCLTTNPQL